MTEFLIQFLWYFVAFAVGALLAWLGARSIEAESEDEAFSDIAGARQSGGRR